MAATLLQNLSANNTVSSTVSRAYTSTPTAGNLLVAFVYSNGTVNTTTISGWTRVLQQATPASAADITMFYKVSAGNEGTIRADATSASVMVIQILEYSGVSSITDGSEVDNTSAGTGMMSATVTTTFQPDLILFGICWQSGGTGGIVFSSSGGTKTNLLTSNANLGSLQVVTNATGGYYFSASWTTSRASADVGLAFKLIVAPTVTTTTPAANIAASTASASGNVTSAGNGTVTERGIVISTSADPTTSNTKFVSGSGTGSFTANLTGLNPNTTYHFRAYAINSQGTSYGSDATFTTLNASGFFLLLRN